MRRKPERITQQAARGENYASHFESRQMFKNFPPETQDLYRRVSLAMPRDWQVNEFGAVMLNETDENYMIQLAVQNRMPHAWYLITFFQSEEGWEDFRRKFEALPEPEKTYPKTSYVKDEVIVNSQKEPE